MSDTRICINALYISAQIVMGEEPAEEGVVERCSGVRATLGERMVGGKGYSGGQEKNGWMGRAHYCLA